MPRPPLLPDVVVHAQSNAPVQAVWALLADLARMSEWDPLLARVEGAGRTPPVGGERFHLVPAGPLGRLPTPLRRIPVDVAVVDPPHELGLVAHLSAGLVERVRVRLLPLPGERTDCELRAQLTGPAAPAYWPVARLARGAALAGLAAAAARELGPRP